MDEQKINALTKNAILGIFCLLLQLIGAAFALWFAGRHWEEAYWALGYLAIPTICFSFLAFTSVWKIRKALLPRSTT
jgi:O-antigen/teichoic acid export membrane protein